LATDEAQLRVGFCPVLPSNPASEVPALDLEPPRHARWRTMAMVAGTLLAVAALLSQVDNLSLLWATIENIILWWVVLAIVFAFGNKTGYAIALMGSVPERLRFGRSIEALLAAAFSNLVLPGVGSTAVQVRYLQRQGVDLAAAVAGGAVLANVANVVVQGTLFLVALLATSRTFDTDRINLDNVGWILTVVVLVAGVAIALVTGVQRIRRRVLPPTRRAMATIRTAFHSPRQVLLLVGGNLLAALMSALCLLACLRAYGGNIDYWPLIVVNILVGTVASLIPVPGGNTLVAALGLSAALVAFGIPDTLAVAAVLTQQLIAGYLPALPGWFATNHMLRQGYL
jgi:undecaprenyl-diphosphatase